MLVESGEAGEREAFANPVRLLVVIANELVRYGVASMLRSIPGIGRVYSCGSAEEASVLLPECRPDVVLCQGSGRAALCLTPPADLHGARILLLLEDLDLEEVDESVMLAAHGFVIQGEATVESLRDAVERLTLGEMSMPAQLARVLMTRTRGEPSPRGGLNVVLTTRERQILSQLAQGLSNKQIARRLAISEHGVKRHVTNLLAKLHSPNRTLAVALALREGLICPPA
jgi:two-component system, NarL family, nitrate/nitrite response regulator NarL